MISSSFDAWTYGYSIAELDAAQERFGLVFPRDLISLLSDRRPVRGYDWRSDEEEIWKALKWPYEGLLFDVETNGLWWPEWDERPSEAEDRAAIIKRVVAMAPPLIPILSHRYIPSEPAEEGNPVFSIYQSDIVYSGAYLDDYFTREFGVLGQPLGGKPKYIRFWSDMVARANKE